jgi:hypothetical protein
LILVPPFRAANHYFDIFYAFGGVAVLILGLQLGVDAFISRPELRRRFVGIFTLMTVLSLGFTCFNFPERKEVMGSFTGFYFLLAIILGISFWNLATIRTKRQERFHYLLLMVCFFTDVSTSHWQFILKNLSTMPTVNLDAKAANGLGLVDEKIEMGLNVAFFLKKSHELKDLGADQLPEVSVFSRYHVSDGVTKEDLARAMAPKDASLEVDRDFIGSDEEKAFLAGSRLNLDLALAKPEMHRIDYNTFEVTLANPSTALLFVRSSFAESWRVEANDRQGRIFRALGNFKMVVLDPGVTKLRFHFFPRSIAISLCISYFLICAVFGRYLFLRYRRA